MQLPSSSPSLTTPASPQPQSLYLQIAAHATGNALFLMAGVFLYAVWTLLADFREPMLWALLCSAALRDMKDFLVRFLSDTLSQDRSLFVASWSLLLLPLRSLTGAALDVYRLMAKWRQLAGERDPSHNRVRHFLAAGHKALQRNRECRLTGSQGQPASSSSILFSWLLRAILVQEIYKGARQSWEVAIAVAAALAAAAAILAWLAPTLRRRFRGRKALTPVGTHQAAAEGGGHAQQPHSMHSTPASHPKQGVKAGRKTRHAVWQAGRFVGRAHRAVDRRVHAWLLPQVNSLVSLGLIVALLLGPLLLSSFMAFQIGQEARDVVVSVREAIPQDWSRVTNESRLMRASYIQDLLNKPWVRAYQQQAYALVQKSVPPAVTWLQGRVDDLAEQHNMTQAVHDVRMLYASFQPPMPCTPAEMQAALIAQAKANAALHDAQQLQARLEHDVSLKRNRTAAAVADWRYQQQNWAGDSGTQPPSAGSGRDAGTCQQEAGVGASTQGIGRSGLDAGPKRQTPAGDDASSEGGALWSDAHPLRKAEKAVVTADADLERVEADLGHAKGEVESAADAAAIAGQAVERCERGAQAQLAGPDGPEHQYGNGMQVLVRGIVMELRARLLGILAKLGRLEFGAVLLDVKDMGKEGFTLAKEVVSSSPEGNGARDFSAVQRLAKVAMQPLLSIGQALGKFAMSSLGSTTNVAMSSGRSVFNIGKGAVTWALQFFVFVGLLYFLLNLETDPLCLALHLMPVSEYACHQTRLAMTNALRGVFVSSLKLMIFHSLFTWITLRAAGTHLTYTCTLGTAVFTALPIVPVWVFALPGSLQLALQGNIWGGVLLFLVNFAAGWADDSLLDDIPGSNSYLIGMGVAGGLSTFDNPLQGVLLGPLIISLMSALYNLSASFMDQDSGAQYMQSPVSEPAYANESQPDSNGGAEPGLHASAVNTSATSLASVAGVDPPLHAAAAKNAGDGASGAHQPNKNCLLPTAAGSQPAASEAAIGAPGEMAHAHPRDPPAGIPINARPPTNEQRNTARLLDIESAKHASSGHLGQPHIAATSNAAGHSTATQGERPVVSESSNATVPQAPMLETTGTVQPGLPGQVTPPAGNLASAAPPARPNGAKDTALADLRPIQVQPASATSQVRHVQQPVSPSQHKQQAVAAAAKGVASSSGSFSKFLRRSFSKARDK